MKKNVFIFLILLFIPVLLYGKERVLTIIHTNDLHSHLLGFSPNIDYTPFVSGDDKTIGGFARIATVVNNIRKDRTNPVLLLDAGDFLMGSLFHMISREYALELRLMKMLRYDAIALGNHEFDLMPDGLARILLAAKKERGLPAIISSNLIFSKESGKDDSLEEVFKKGLIKPYIILKRNGIKIGFFGLIGKDAAEVAPFAKPVRFDDQIKVSREMVKLLRDKEKVDMVICLSHSGLRKDRSKSEDEILAQEVSGIDIIISGHTHTRLQKPIILNNTIIVQAWEYGKMVGVLDIAFNEGRVVLKKYNTIEINDSIKGDIVFDRMINIYTGAVNMNVLKYHGFGFMSIIAHTDFDLVKTVDESNLGNLLADSIRWYINKHEYNPDDPMTKVAFSIESCGVIRDNLLKGKTGNIAVCDLFRTIPLGIGMDGTMAYPLITFYLYPSEVKKALEVVTSIYPLKGSDYFLQVSGVKFRYNPNRMLFDRVTDIWIGSEEEGYKPLDYSDSNKKLYRTAANIYNSMFIKIVGDFTWDILKIVPKDRNGKPIDDMITERVDADKEKPGIQELKEWIGVMEYVRSFKDRDGDGIPDIPEKYKGKLGRIVKAPSWNPVSLLKGGNYLTWTAFALVFLIIIILFLLFMLIRRIVRKIRS